MQRALGDEHFAAAVTAKDARLHAALKSLPFEKEVEGAAGAEQQTAASDNVQLAEELCRQCKTELTGEWF